MSDKIMTRTLKFCYTKVGTPLQRVITNPIISVIVGAFMNTALSSLIIKGFIRRNKIDMTDFADEKYHCFNDFFTRHLKDGARPIESDESMLISPCDGNMTAYKIGPDSEFSIKDSYYTIGDLLGGDELGREYLNGTCLILRLAVDNYHRYCYIDNGTKSENVHIRGRYHSVQPIVVHSRPIFKQNTREYCVLHTDNFGDVVQIEVGACLVGKIRNHHGAGEIRRAEEKGMFLFGGSTIVLLFKEGAIDLDDEVFEATKNDYEAKIKYGEAIARKGVL